MLQQHWAKGTAPLLKLLQWYMKCLSWVSFWKKLVSNNRKQEARHKYALRKVLQFRVSFSVGVVLVFFR